MHTNYRLILFTRFPEPGRTKTRLIPALGAGGAARLHKVITEKIANEAIDLQQTSAIPTTIYFSGSTKEKMAHWLGSSFTYIEQAEGDIGARMAQAFSDTFASGTTSAILVGSDIPDISSDLLRQAFSALQTTEVIIGPSQDGGYYLIGFRAGVARQLIPLLFLDIPWSTDVVFPTTIHRIKQSGCTYTLLPTLKDIDLPEDIPFAKTRGLL
jgi:rSAM/selenodomain-associated transferase 1